MTLGQQEELRAREEPGGCEITPVGRRARGECLKRALRMAALS